MKYSYKNDFPKYLDYNIHLQHFMYMVTNETLAMVCLSCNVY